MILILRSYMTKQLNEVLINEAIKIVKENSFETVQPLPPLEYSKLQTEWDMGNIDELGCWFDQVLSLDENKE